MLHQFLLPDVGEGLTEADIVVWRVAEGDEVEVNDVLVEIETAKSIVELPSPFAGRVTSLLASEGETVQVGTPIVEIEGEGAQPPAEGDDEDPPTLVGYGASHGKDAGPRRRRRLAREGLRELVGGVLAKPPVRAHARGLGVAIDEVVGTGEGGSVTREDVEAHAEEFHAEEGRRIPIRGVRKATAANMVQSVSTHVHVSEWVTVDVSATVELVERLKARKDFQGLRVSPLLVVAKVIGIALGRHPQLNARWDDEAQEIVLQPKVNLGIAAATPRGLMVPNIKDAGRMGLLELCQRINDVVRVARDGKLQPGDHTGGTFTITNVGVFGIDAGTPIINGDESAIFCMGQIARRPWVVGEGRDERIEPRWVTTLTVAFDHRLIDGEQGSRFLADVAEMLHDPVTALLH